MTFTTTSRTQARICTGRKQKPSVETVPIRKADDLAIFSARARQIADRRCWRRARGVSARPTRLPDCRLRACLAPCEVDGPCMPRSPSRSSGGPIKLPILSSLDPLAIAVDLRARAPFDAAILGWGSLSHLRTDEHCIECLSQISAQQAVDDYFELVSRS